ncbi:hypothetical protein BYT27DRAFT_7261107 [Phlegmacium glaucopus]|nr:hypothetical protein BYT27DRAFT_7261107 [Phlegmacium glaucopus]
MHISEIGQKSGIEARKVGRVLRILASKHIFREVSDNVFANNRLSIQLLSSNPLSSLGLHLSLVSRSQPDCLAYCFAHEISSELFDVTTLSLQTLFRKRTTADLGVPVLLSVARFARQGFWCCTRDADKIQNGGLATERGSGAMKGCQLPFGLEVEAAIGLFHVHAHKDECFFRYATSFIPGAGVVAGEILESLWSTLNSISPTARTATLVHRAEMLDDHAADSNHKKMLGMVSTLCKSHRRAVDMLEHAQSYYKSLTIQGGPIAVDRWKQDIESAERSRPFDITAMDIYAAKLESTPVYRHAASDTRNFHKLFDVTSESLSHGNSKPWSLVPWLGHHSGSYPRLVYSTRTPDEQTLPLTIGLAHQDPPLFASEIKFEVTEWSHQTARWKFRVQNNMQGTRPLRQAGYGRLETNGARG